MGGTGDNPKLGDLRGKIVILEDFQYGENSRYSNLDWDTFANQGEWQMDCHYDLYSKWQAVEGHLERAASRYYDPFYQDEIYVNFLSAAYDGELACSVLAVGSCIVHPYFVASGHKAPATDSKRKDTDADDSYPANYQLYPDFPSTGCQEEVKSAGIVWKKAKCDIEYEGTNILTADYLSRQTSLQRVGIIMADFPGKDLISQVIRMNELPVNQPPVANLTGPNGADPYITHEGWLEFDASGSTDAVVGEGIRNVLVHTTLFLEGSFTDVGALDTHTANVQWGDGRSSSEPSTGSVTVMHRYGEASGYRIELEVVDDDTGVDTAGATIKVVESAHAIEDLAAELAGGTNGSGAVISAAIAVQRDRIAKLAAADQSADEAIQQAIAKLSGRGGALEMLTQGNTNAALVKMWQAMELLETAEAVDASLDLTSEKQTLALSAKSTAVTAILQAENLASTRKDLTMVAHAYDLVDEADTLLAAHDFVNAVEAYRAAAQEVQGIHAEK